MELYHYGPTGLSVLDPALFGKNSWTSPREYNEAAYPRVFFYTARGKVESQFKQPGMVRYRAAQDLSVYDIARDPHRIIENAQAKAEAAGMQMFPKDYEPLIRAAGYDGYRVGGVVAVWTPVKVEPVAE